MAICFVYWRLFQKYGCEVSLDPFGIPKRPGIMRLAGHCMKTEGLSHCTGSDDSAHFAR
jgi:hypothetical protein